jgi:membrane dipeptidase
MTDVPVFDAHSDVPFRLVRERDPDGGRSVLAEEFLPAMRANGILARIAAVYIRDEFVPEMAINRALRTIQAVYDDAARADGAEVVTTAAAVRENAAEGVASLVLGMEGAEPLGRDPALLDVYHRLGVRVLGLTHARRNFAGDGAALREGPDREVRQGGLSAFGEDLVERAGELGVVVDTAHLNERGFFDAVALADDPVVNSHSNCRALADHPRNLTDEQIEAVADTGGVVGLTALDFTLAADRPTVADVLDHLDHAVDLVGVDHVGLGFDFYGYIAEYFDDGPGGDHPPVEGLQADDDVGALPGALADRGYTDAEVRQITWENPLRVLEAVVDDRPQPS